MTVFTQAKPHVLSSPAFPRASRYDPAWIFEHQMGPNALWLAEWLAKDLQLRPGMRVLDLGCGKALTSIFLAHEFDVEVWAADLWVDASENLKRIEAAGLGRKVFPINADAHRLPFAASFFDAVVSVDSYHYFGTDQLYLGRLQRFLRPSGEIGVVVPGLHREFPDGIPAHLRKKQSTGSAFWQWDCCTFHTAGWWRQLWSAYPFLEVRACEVLPDGGQRWLEWEKALHGWPGEKAFPPDIEALTADDERYLTFTKIVGRISADRDEQVIGASIGER